MNTKKCHSIKESPCMGCESRSAECHGKCEHYAEYRRHIDAWKKDKAERRTADEYTITQIMRRKDKNGRR